MSKFDDMHDDLKLFLRPYLISPDCLIIPKALLIFANIITGPLKPFSASYGPGSENKMYIQIENITRDEADVLLNYFRNELDDKTASYDRAYQNSMEKISNYDEFLFLLDTETFTRNFVPRFKEYVSKAGCLELYDYRTASADDIDISRYRETRDMCADLGMLEEKYKEQALIASTLAQTREALQKYKHYDVPLYYACLGFNEMMIGNNAFLCTDKRLCDVRDRLFDYCDYAAPIPVIFNMVPEAPSSNPEAAINSKKENCLKHKARKAVHFFKEAGHGIISCTPCHKEKKPRVKLIP